MNPTSSALFASSDVLLMNLPNKERLLPECCQHHISHKDESPFTANACRAGVKLQRQTHLLSVLLCDAVA